MAARAIDNRKTTMAEGDRAGVEESVAVRPPMRECGVHAAHATAHGIGQHTIQREGARDAAHQAAPM